MEKRKYQIFVSSTFTDLEEERKKIFNTLLDMNCFPAGMEYFPAIDENQFNYIKRVIDECDYYVLVIAGKYGTIHPKDGISYTELEYNYAISKSKPIIALIHGDPGQISADKSELKEENRLKLEVFKANAKSGRNVQFWKNADELARKLATSLLHTINIKPSKGWIRADDITNKKLLEENDKMRKEIESLKKRLGRTEADNSKYLKYLLNYIIDSTSPASLSDYKKWLEGFKAIGGKVADYKKSPSDRLRLAKTDLYLPPLYSVHSFEIIVENGVKIKYLDSDIGHSHIYYLDDFVHVGHGDPFDVG